MIINCFRCGKEIDAPDDSNADYIMASDTIAKEPREVLIALKHNQATLKKRGGGEEISDSEYDAIEVPDIATASRTLGEDLVKVIAEVREKNIQKTGIICPKCHKPTDFVIWGVHKVKVEKQ